ncbi:hypothetical protein QNM97_09665 [Gordonia sp. L191]|uniref:hypothetical protein n=1 Tax=Gordonia sp. L191 TaxID=2982699 RepID=UPI0024C001C7|nr:hypothetical protein [Gordonia sp. L191]WHU49209.1 hypothetical protein QNM97_09665 [Gordonia sp. L191]
MQVFGLVPGEVTTGTAAHGPVDRPYCYREYGILIDRPGLVTAEQFHSAVESAVESGALGHDSMTHDVVHVRQLTPDVALLVAPGRNTGRFRKGRTTQVTSDAAHSFAGAPHT